MFLFSSKLELYALFGCLVKEVNALERNSELKLLVNRGRIMRINLKNCFNSLNVNVNVGVIAE